MYFIFFIIISLIFGVEVSEVRYDGYQVLRIVPKNVKQLQNLQDIKKQYKKISFWNYVIRPNKEVDILVPPSDLKNFKNSLILSNLTFSVTIKNIQHLLDRQSSFKSSAKSVAFDWNTYQNLDAIYGWLKSLTVRYPKIVTLVHGGKTFEGRNITGVKIFYNERNKAVFIEGGIHARERISPATCTYIVNQLLTSQDHNVRIIAESRNWYIFPVTNPDGYEYTKRDKLWRKNRNPITPECTGVDLNRNWGYKWMHGGGSTNPCEADYAGNTSFSEIETRSLSRFFDSIADTLEGYISFHSFGQLLMIPFGHNEYEVPKNNNELRRIAHIAVATLAKRYGTNYTVTNIYNFSLASGNSVDWVLGFHRHLKFVYVFELRNTFTFILPPEEIIPTGEETLDSLVSIIQQIQKSEDEDC